MFSSKENKNYGAVFTLHSVRAGRGLENRYNEFIEISEHKVEELIKYLVRLGVRFVSLTELEESLLLSKPGKPLVHMSIDDGYADNFQIAFPIFKKYKVPFSIFITTNFIDTEKPFWFWYYVEAMIKAQQLFSFPKYSIEITQESYKQEAKEALASRINSFLIENIDKDRAYFTEQILAQFDDSLWSTIPSPLSWEQIREMQASGLCSIGVHTCSHARFTALSEVEQKKEVQKSIKVLEEQLAERIKYFSFPYGTYKDIGERKHLPELLREQGIIMAFTTEPEELNSSADKYFVPRLFINEQTTNYSLRARLNGSYQRSISRRIFNSDHGTS